MSNTKFILTRGIGFGPGSTKYIPTHGFAVSDGGGGGGGGSGVPGGRDSLGVTQGSADGAVYPFICPSDSLDLLIADIYLNYKDAGCDHGKHFKIDWLCGFGPDAAVGTPEPGSCSTHPYDLQISDSEDNVIFDSSEATYFAAYGWGTKYKVLEWVNDDDEILRIVIFTAWDPDLTPQTWPSYFEPADGRLDPRTYQRIPDRVKQISVVTDKDDPSKDVILPSEKGLVLRGGHNIEITPETVLGGDGDKLVQPLTIHAAPGLGIGKVPCDVDDYVRKINDVTADDKGNVILDTFGCYRLERPLEGPADDELELPFQSAEVTEAALQISNDCGPCCECEDFVNVYEAIRRLSNKYEELGQRAEAVRDQYKFNKKRWLDDKQCRKGTSLQLAMQELPYCRVAVAAALCNTTDGPIHNVELRLCFKYGPDSDGLEANTTLPGCILCNTTTRRGNNSPTGKPSAYRTHPYKLSGQWPRFSAYFDCINPGENGIVSFLMYFPGCADGDRVEIVLRAYGEDTGGAPPISDGVPLNPYGEESCCDDIDPSDHEGDTDALCDTDLIDGL